jgi:hypothetical protein
MVRVILLLSLFAVSHVHAATKSELMLSRYLRYQFCMERAFGQGFYDRLSLITVINQWGASEPTLASLQRASGEVRRRDTACRRDNDLSDEPRP